MSPNKIKMNFESYFKLEVDRMLSSNFPGQGQRCKKSKIDIEELNKTQAELVRRMEAKKMLLIEFTQRITKLYATRYGDLLSRQQTEIVELKKKFAEDVKYEVKRWQKCRNYVKQEEEKLIKQLHHLKKIYSLPGMRNGILKKVADMQKVFIEKRKELLLKYRSEAKSLGEALDEEVSEVQKNIIREYRRKELKVTK